MKSLRQMDWTDIIIHFIELRQRESLSDKELLDYFHFRYLTATGLDRWTMPNYRMYKASAKKLLDLYGKDFSIELIDLLFKEYKIVFNKEFGEVRWSIGLLSSDRTGWIIERLLKQYYKEKSTDKQDFIARLLARPRSQWTLEERKQFEEAIQ